MYGKIVPIMRLPRKLENFDYLIPEKLEEKIAPGQIVEIPFRNSQRNGIIFSIHRDRSRSNLKHILRIIDNNPIISDVQIKLIIWASFYYCSSPANFLKTIIPEIPKFKKSAETKQCLVYTTKKFKILKSELPKIQKILKKILENKKILLQWNNYYNKTAVYVKLLEKFSLDRQVILIFPKLSDIKKFLNFLPEKLKFNASILHSELPNKKHFQEWENIKNKKNGIIIGTRQAIFAPAKNLGLIIIDNEEDISHKQWDQNPRYHSLKIARKLQEITDAKILIASSIPSAETYYMAKKEKYEIILEDDNYDLGIKKHIRIIQMQDEWNKKNYSIFSDDALDSIKKNISLNKNSIVYINRRGTSQLVICKDCGYIPLCPKCHLSLSLHIRQKNVLKCHHCDFTKIQETPCPKCNGFNIKQIGTGTEKAEKILKEIFKDAKIIRIDADAKPPHLDQSALNRNDKILASAAHSTASGQPMADTAEWSRCDGKIIIATNAVLNYDLPANTASCIFLNIDTNLNVPNFRAFENTAQIIKNLSLFLEPNGELIIQSYGNLKESFLFFKKNYNFTKYYNGIIEERRNTNYPPFSQLIKLTFKNRDDKMVQFESEKLLNLLKKQFLGNKKVSILGPVSLPVRFKKYSQELVIKNCGHCEDLQKWLINNVCADLIIDVDPVEI